MRLTCADCHRTLDDRTETVWTKVTGWERRRHQGGTNHVSLRQLHDEHLCDGCRRRRQLHISQHQQALL